MLCGEASGGGKEGDNVKGLWGQWPSTQFLQGHRKAFSPES